MAVVDEEATPPVVIIIDDAEEEENEPTGESSQDLEIEDIDTCIRREVDAIIEQEMNEENNVIVLE